MDTVGSPVLWAGFIGLVFLMLALDLGVFHRKAHIVAFKEASIWTGVWITLSLIFCGFLWWQFGAKSGTDFLTGYLIEKSLSIDNIFVFVVIFGSMKIPPLYQHRVLFWGILSALILRAIMIFAGVAALERFHWLIYVFGVFLIVTGLKLFLDWKKGEEDDPGENFFMKFIRKTVPSTNKLDGQHFFTIENRRKLATPLFMALILVEITDVIFALDSIPAIFAITRDPFIVFTSNIFAILGLRSMYFMLAGMMEKFGYLKVGLSAVLVFVGTKMAIVDLVHIPSWLSLLVIALCIGLSIVASLIKANRDEQKAHHAPMGEHGSDQSSGPQA